MPIISLPGRRPDTLGIIDGRLSPCPSSPNAVCSDAPPGPCHVEPFSVAGQPEPAWTVALQEVALLPRTEIVTATHLYLHAECHSRLLGFVDDLELHFRPAQGMIAVRSASRLGHSDLGVNRRRVERLRSSLIEAGVVKGPG